MLPLILGRAEGWPVWTWLSLGASVPVFGGFVAAERRLQARVGTPLVSLDAMNAVSEHHAHDISGVTTTTTTIARAIAIAAFGTVYLSLASDGAATHAFAVVTAAFAAIAVLAPALAHGATRARVR